jgi:hypothetical protein
MIRRALFLLLFGLTACAPLPGAHAGAGRFSFALGAQSEPAEPAPAPIAVAGQPSPAAPTPADRPTPPAPPATGGGATGATATQVAGAVHDLTGAPLAGVTLTGADVSLTSDAAGGFAFSSTGAAPLLTASLSGYLSQTLGPPYRFALAPALPAPQAPYTLEGVTDPPVDGALVAFADAGGVTARTVTAGGRFSLTITPNAATPVAGLLVVAQDVGWAGSERYRVLQAATPMAGALTTDGTADSGLVVPLTPVSERLAIGESGVPAGLRPAGAELAVVAPDGTAVSLNWSVGAWPAAMPVPRLPGLQTTVRVSAQDTEATMASAAENLIAPGETAWTPSLLAPPDVAVDAAGSVSWPAGTASTVLTVAPHPNIQPVWEGVVTGSDYRLPVAPPGGELLVRVWDVADPPLPSRPQGATSDRRSASRRLPLPTPAPADSAE